MKRFTYTITDPVGIHARPAGILVKEVKKYQSVVTVSNDNGSANAGKLMALMRLGIKCGDTVTLMQGGSEGICDHTSFLSLLVLEGTGELCTTAETRSLQAGDSLFLPAGTGAFRVQGLCQVLCNRL